MMPPFRHCYPRRSHPIPAGDCPQNNFRNSIVPAFRGFGSYFRHKFGRRIHLGEAADWVSVETGGVAVSQLAALQEFRSVWLPHTTDAGLTRLAELLRAGSPLLISGSFSLAIPQGCLASHIAWNHPETAKFAEEAGVCWLARVAGLNPATSAVILAWDQAGSFNWDLRQELLAACIDEQRRRASTSDHSAELAELVLCAI